MPWVAVKSIFVYATILATIGQWLCGKTYEAVPAATKPNPRELRLPPSLPIGGRDVPIAHNTDLNQWWNAGPYPPDLPGLNAHALAAKIDALSPSDHQSELARQADAWLPIAEAWATLYRYQVRTNPVNPNISEIQERGYALGADGQLVRVGRHSHESGNFAAAGRLALMEAILRRRNPTAR